MDCYVSAIAIRPYFLGILPLIPFSVEFQVVVYGSSLVVGSCEWRVAVHVSVVAKVLFGLVPVGYSAVVALLQVVIVWSVEGLVVRLGVAGLEVLGGLLAEGRVVPEGATQRRVQLAVRVVLHSGFLFLI